MLVFKVALESRLVGHSLLEPPLQTSDKHRNGPIFNVATSSVPSELSLELDKFTVLVADLVLTTPNEFACSKQATNPPFSDDASSAVYTQLYRPPSDGDTSRDPRGYRKLALATIESASLNAAMDKTSPNRSRFLRAEGGIGRIKIEADTERLMRVLDRASKRYAEVWFTSRKYDIPRIVSKTDCLVGSDHCGGA